MYKDFKTHLENEIKNTKNSGLFKKERIIISPQSSIINTNNQKEIINLKKKMFLLSLIFVIQIMLRA